MNKEDIKILEDIIKQFKNNREIFYNINEKEIKALENLINRNKEIEEDYTSVYLSGFYDGENKWKSKIKEKIEELKQERTLKYDNYMGYKIESREQQDIDKKVQVLQELLQEGEDNANI